MTATLERLSARPSGGQLRDIDTGPAQIGDRAERLVDLASGWLRAEALSVSQPGRPQLVRIAVERALAYEGALVAASTEDIRLAWEEAVARQSRTDVGSVPWATAVRVSELLRFEYEAAREARKP